MSRQRPAQLSRPGPRLDAQEETGVADGLVRREGLGSGSVQVQQHGVLVAGEALRAHRALGGALLGKATEARQHEAAALEELGHQRERENAPGAETARLRDARLHQSAADPAPGGLATHRQRAHLGQIGREHGERAAPQEVGPVARHDEVTQVLEQEVARSLEHAVLGRVGVDEHLHVLDVLDARGPDQSRVPRRGGDVHYDRRARAASSRASRTRTGAVPPGDARAASERSARISSSAEGSKRGSCRRSSSSVRPTRSFPAERRSRTSRPTIAWASRNGTPRRARWSARSVAPSMPRSVAARIAAGSKRSPRTTRANASIAGATSVASYSGTRCSCRSEPYARGSPFSVVRTATRSPMIRPVRPRTSSATSGFFFCGMMLDPVACSSASSAKPNSALVHSTRSSANREACTETSAATYTKSVTKSRSATASTLLRK